MSTTAVSSTRTSANPGPTRAAADLFAGPGEMRALCRAFDWAATPLGPVESWSQSLRTTAGIVLGSRNPMFLWWGPELVQIYNDAYRPSLGFGARHPGALGARGKEFWTDIWTVIGPQIDQVMSGGESTWHEDQYLPIERNGRLEDVWWTYSYSAVRDVDGHIAGTLVVCLETTPRILAEREREQLRANTARAERRAARVLQQVSDEHLTMDAEFRILSVNAAAERALGLSEAELLGRTHWEAFPASVGTEIERTYRRVVTDRVEAHMQHHYVGEGYDRHLEIDAYPTDEGGIALFWRDVSERVNAIETLRASESRYRALFDSLDQGFCVLEMMFDDAGRPVDYRFLETNPAFVQQTGLMDAIGRTARELVPNLEQHWVDVYGQVAVSGEAKRFQLGSEPMGRWFDVYAFRAGAPDERRVALLFTDISAARAAERERERLLGELRLERSRLAYIFQQAPAFLAVLRGPRLVFELANDAYYQLVGHRELIGKAVFDALPEVRDQGFETRLARVLETGEPYIGREIRLLVARTPGAPIEERYIDLAYLPIVEADGTRSGIIAHGTDVTEQVLARREVERLLGESEMARADAEAARALAESANQAKTQFLANMSHELRTPLNAIQGHAQLLDMGLHGPVTGDQREVLARIDRAQTHLLGLVNDVLNFARLGAGRVEYDLRPTLVPDVLDDVLPMVEPQLAAKQLALEVHLPERGPNGPTGHPAIPVLADREKLGQIFLNLLSNAIKFTPPGGRIRIELSARDDGTGTSDHVHFRVTDTGIGIPRERLEAVFEPFVQVRSDYARSSGGTGLGLAISRDLARGMGGDLRARSEEGRGSSFTVTLRRAL